MPNLHPVFVHYPIALLTVTFLFEVFAQITSHDGLSRAGWWMQLSGTVGLAVTVVTGILAQHSVVLPPNANASFNLHQELAFVTSSLFVLLLFWRVAKRTRVPPEHRVAFLALFLLAVCSLLIGGWFGGELVYRFGTVVVSGGY